MFLAAALCAAMACSPQGGGETGAQSETGAAETASTETAAGGGGERFYGEETFTIVYDQTGAEAGAFTEHVREWGRKRVEIAKTKLSMAGLSIAKDQRIIYDRDQIITVDNTTGSTTIAGNSLYNEIVGAMDGRTGVEFGEQMMRAFGGEKTGETGSFAGQACEFWTLPQLGARSCVTPWGATLFTEANIGGINITRTAKEVRMGDGGPDAAFAYDASKAQQQEDVGEMLKRL